MPSTALRECECPVPEPKLQKPTVCVRCGFSIDTDWVCNDRTVANFLDRLGETIIGGGEMWQQFRLHLEAREAAGRSTFRQTFLGKDLLQEAREEAVDLALYLCLQSLKRLRAGDDQHMDLVLTVAHHAYQAYAATIELHHKELGAP